MLEDSGPVRPRPPRGRRAAAALRRCRQACACTSSRTSEWNAFAMGNYSIYVFSGPAGRPRRRRAGHRAGPRAGPRHARAHAPPVQEGHVGAAGGAGRDRRLRGDRRQERSARWRSCWSLFGAQRLANGYGRDMEDQADRVGLRYAYEAGYDITQGPAPVAALREEVRRVGQGGQLLLRQPLAVLAAGREPGAGRSRSTTRTAPRTRACAWRRRRQDAGRGPQPKLRCRRCPRPGHRADRVPSWPGSATRRPPAPRRRSGPG